MRDIQIRRPVASAIAWTLLGEIIRRHGGRMGLRVIETHPGGGMYDLLTLLKLSSDANSVYENSHELGSINLQTGRLSGTEGSIDGFNVNEVWFTHQDPKDVVELAEREFRLPPVQSLPHSTAWTFGPRLLAALLGSQLTRRNFLDVRMGFADTSGYGGGPAPDLQTFAAIFSAEREGAPIDRIERAALCWLLYSGPSKKLTGVLRLDGLLCSATQPDQVHDEFARYRKFRSLSNVVSHCCEVLQL